MSVSIEKLLVSSKKNVPLYTSSISYCGKFLALGGGDHNIYIWNASEFAKPRRKETSLSPISVLKAHSGSVNTIRWTTETKHVFASCSDDKSIVVWHKIGPKDTSFTIKHIFHGHKSDVEEISWSPDGTKIASGSLDNTVMIWDTVKMEAIAVLKGHSGWVNGCLWSPDDCFVVSQSKDAGVLLWDTKDWKKIKAFKNPFEDPSLLNLEGPSSHKGRVISRMSLSPDGRILCCPKGFDGVYTAAAFDCKLRKHLYSIAGHSDSVLVTAFSPLIYSSKEMENGVCLFVTGSNDTSLCFWRTDRPKPIAVFEDVFDEPVSDVSWFSDGTGFIAVSLDGSGAIFKVKEYLDKFFCYHPLITKRKSFFKNIFSLNKGELVLKNVSPKKQKISEKKTLLQEFKRYKTKKQISEKSLSKRKNEKMAHKWTPFVSNLDLNSDQNLCFQKKVLFKGTKTNIEVFLETIGDSTRIKINIQKKKHFLKMPLLITAAVIENETIYMCSRDKLFMIHPCCCELENRVVFYCSEIVHIASFGPFFLVMCKDRTFEILKVKKESKNCRLSVFLKGRLPLEIDYECVESTLVREDGMLMVRLENGNVFRFSAGDEIWCSENLFKTDPVGENIGNLEKKINKNLF